MSKAENTSDTSSADKLNSGSRSLHPDELRKQAVGASRASRARSTGHCATPWQIESTVSGGDQQGLNFHSSIKQCRASMRFSPWWRRLKSGSDTKRNQARQRVALQFCHDFSLDDEARGLTSTGTVRPRVGTRLRGRPNLRQMPRDRGLLSRVYPTLQFQTLHTPYACLTVA